MSFSPDSKTLAAEDSRIFGGAVRLWDVATGEPLQKIFQGGYVSPIYIFFSPDGQTLAVLSSLKTRVYDVATDRLRYIIKHSHSYWYLRGVPFSPDGRIFITSHGYPGPMGVWNISTGTLRYTLEERIGNFAFSPPDGLTLAGVDGKIVRLWNAATGRLRNTLEGHTNGVESVSFSGDGKTLAVSSGGAVHLWNVATGTLRKTLEVEGGVDSVSFSPDSKTLVTASDDRGEKTVRLWDVATGTLRNTFEGYTFNVKNVSFSPDGKTLVSVGGGWRDETVRLWDVASRTLRDIFQHGGGLSVSFSPDGKIVASGSSDETVRLWDVSEGTLRNTLEGHTDEVNSVSFSPDGQTLASGSSDETVRLWDVSEGTLRHTFEGHADEVNSVSFSPDGQTLASGSSDETVRLWDVSEGTLLRTLPICAKVNSVAFSPDGKTLANGHDSGRWKEDIHLWDVATGTFLRALEIPGPDYPYFDVNSVSFSPNGQILASGVDDGPVHLWDVATGTLLHTFEGHLADVNSVAFSPDGLTLASASDDGQILLWRVGGWEEEPANAPASIQVSLLPQETALLANYPNPFNPETWIPYQLATPADVTLTIYNIQGRVVRDLDLGHQRAGMYHTRSRAAYWDGRNAQGESVASGVYFYTLTAGDFNATRKLLIRK